MTEQQNSYRQILKATSIFGGVQVFQILISIIRSKFIAILLGPSGMGVVGLLTSTIALISGLTNFGIGTSAVRNIADANRSANNVRIAIIIKVIRRLFWITGILGTIITITFAPWLSQLTFGNRNFTSAFYWISISLLINQLTSGQLVVMQGLRKLNYLAKANLIGSTLGLIITLPLYFKFGESGIVPGIIITSIISLFLSWIYSKRLKFIEIKVSRIRTIAEGRGIILLGLMISLSGIISVSVSYIVRIYISRIGGIDQVGLYNAGFAIINTYVGLVFTAMATDYYPRLSAVAHDNQLCKTTINQQAEIALLILSPILITFLIFINWVVILLYSTKFISINYMIYWAALGMFFKASTWAVGFLFLANGSSKLFFWNELIVNIYLLLLNVIGYYYWKLTGLGLSFLLTYFIYFFQIYFVAKKNFSFSFDYEFKIIFFFQFCLALISFLIVRFISTPYSYIFGLFLICLSSWYSIKELNKRIGIISLIKST